MVRVEKELDLNQERLGMLRGSHLSTRHKLILNF